jgi:hypothetical protein
MSYVAYKGHYPVSDMRKEFHRLKAKFDEDTKKMDFQEMYHVKKLPV